MFSWNSRDCINIEGVQWFLLSSIVFIFKINRVSVIAVYKQSDKKKLTTKMTSPSSWVTTGGCPMPPKLSLTSVGLQEVTLAWEPGRCHEDIEIMGYALLKNTRPSGETIPYGITEKNIKDLKPGKCSFFPTVFFQCLR